jgi:outer membrane protein TolC
VEVENIKPYLKRLENAQPAALLGFKILLNLPQESEIEVAGEFNYTEDALPALDDLIAEAKSNNLKIQTLKIKNQLDEEFKAIDQGAYWPTLVAFGNYAFNGTSEEWDFTQYQSSTVGVSLSINLFQGLRTKHKVEQDEIVYKQTKEQIKSLTDAIEMQVKSKYNDLLRVRDEISAMSENVKLAQEAYDIAESRFNQGLGNHLEVNDADVALSKARVNYTQAVHDYLVAKAALYDLVGRVDNSYYQYVKEYLK